MEDVTDSKFYSTARNLEQYAKVFGKTRAEMISWLSTKEKVLNIASGGGLLEKEFKKIPNNKTQIYSMDLMYSSQKGLEFHRYATHLMMTEDDISTKQFETKLKRTNSDFERKIVAADFNHLPFSDNSLDGVLASYAFVHINDAEKLNKLYEEIYRVLKPGGESLITTGRDILPKNTSFDIGEIHRAGTHSFVSFTKPISSL